MKKISLLVIFFPLYVLAQPFAGKIGVNLEGVSGIALPFTNVTLTAGGWQSVATSNNAATDNAGWPTEDFRVVFFDHRPFNAWNNAPDDPQKYVIDMSGTYTLSFAGQANVTSWSDAPVQFLNQSYDTATNVTTMDIFFPPGGGANQSVVGNYGFFMLNFLQTVYVPGVGGVKNIRMVRPGYQHNSPQIFRTSFLNALSPFSTLRFMDFLSINNSNVTYPQTQTWAERQQPDAPLYSKGVPWETVIALANYTGKDIWINIPVDADSMYIVQLAILIKNTLRTDVNIYIEYSNEVWNGGFTQYDYNYSAVLQSPEDTDIRASTPFDDRRRARRVAKEVIKFGKIFENALGVPVALRTRIRPVFAWQFGGYLPWYDDVLTWINSTYGAPGNFIYGIASAPYFGDTTTTASAQQIVSAMSVKSDENIVTTQALAAYAAQWQIKNLQYEGGPDNGGGSINNLSNRITANRISDMKGAVLHNYADNWFSATANGTAPIGTNDLINYFSLTGAYSRFGCWGATEDISLIKTLASAPKYDALCVLTGMCGNEPSVALSAPVNNAAVPVSVPLNLSATVIDSTGTTKKVDFFVGSTLVGVDSTAPYSVSWTPSQTGIFAVLAKAIDSEGRYTFTDANVIQVAEVSGVNKTNAKFNMTVYPNPTIDKLNVELAHVSGAAYIEIYNSTGIMLYRRRTLSSANLIDLASQPPGLYMLKVSSGNYTPALQKVIKE